MLRLMVGWGELHVPLPASDRLPLHRQHGFCTRSRHRSYRKVSSYEIRDAIAARKTTVILPSAVMVYAPDGNIDPRHASDAIGYVLVDGMVDRTTDLIRKSIAAAHVY